VLTLRVAGIGFTTEGTEGTEGTENIEKVLLLFTPAFAFLCALCASVVKPTGEPATDAGIA
jgi:hypothetical protein